MRAVVVAIALFALAAPAAADPVVLTARPALGYRNGRPHRIQVVSLGWAEVEVSTARAFVAMATAASEDGIELWITSGFRSQDEQRAFYQAYLVSDEFFHRYQRLLAVTRAATTPDPDEAAKKTIVDFLESVEGTKHRVLEGGLAQIGPALVEEILSLHMLADGTTDRAAARQKYLGGAGG